MESWEFDAMSYVGAAVQGRPFVQPERLPGTAPHV